MTITTWPTGPFRTSDLTTAGLSRHRLADGLASGALRRIVRGVVSAADLPDSMELRAAAVALAVSEHHVVCDRTAAWLHGVDALLYQELEILPPIEVCALRGHDPSARRGVDARTRDLPAGDIMRIGAVRVTTPMRTALDLGCHLRRREAFAALNALVRIHAIPVAELRASARRLRGRRGVRQLRELLHLVDPRVESARESWTLLAIHDAGLSLPEPQVWIDVDGVPTFRLDLAYRRAKVCVEYNGFDAHDASEEQRDYDRRRRAWLEAHGWTVIEVRVGDFTGDALERWLAELRAALRPTYSPRRF